MTDHVLVIDDDPDIGSAVRDALGIGDLSQELPLPQHFEQAASLVTPDMLAEKTPVGPDVQRYVESVKSYIEAGVENVYIHQVGPDQEGFFRFFRDELRPALDKFARTTGSGDAR